MKTTGTNPAAVRDAPRPVRFSWRQITIRNWFRRSPVPVDEVYGRFPTDGISSGRPRYLATPLRKRICGITSACSISMASLSIIS